MSRSRGAAVPSQHEVWLVDLNPTVGHEQGGVRPALIVSDDRFNHSRAGLVIVAPITGTDRSLNTQVRVEPPEGGLVKTSFIMTDQLRTISMLRLGRRLGGISQATRSTIEDRLRFLLTL